MKFKFNVGETVFIASRYKGIQAVKVLSNIDFNGEPCYELDKLVQITKNGDCVGSREYELFEPSIWFEPDTHTHCPCPEHLLFVVGDYANDNISNLFGTSTGDIFTEEMAQDILLKSRNI